MPIRLNRTENVHEQLKRLTYDKGLDIKDEAVEFLYTHPSHYYTAEELVGRFNVAAAAVQVESVLSHHPDLFDCQKEDGQLYWQIADVAAAEATFEE